MGCLHFFLALGTSLLTKNKFQVLMTFINLDTHAQRERKGGKSYRSSILIQLRAHTHTNTTYPLPFEHGYNITHERTHTYTHIHTQELLMLSTALSQSVLFFIKSCTYNEKKTWPGSLAIMKGMNSFISHSSFRCESTI